MFLYSRAPNERCILETKFKAFSSSFPVFKLFSILLVTNHRKAAVFNMDPANENLPYEADVDIAELVDVEAVAAKLSLGPNGSLLYAMEFLEKNLSWLEKKLIQHKDKYVLFDFPGQVELYTHNGCIRNIVQRLLREGHRVRRTVSTVLRSQRPPRNDCVEYRTNWLSVLLRILSSVQLTAINLVDSQYCADPSKFIAVMLTSLTLMLQLEMPAVNVLSKIDLIEEYGPLRTYKFR